MKTRRLLALMFAIVAAVGFVGYAVAQNSQPNRLAQTNKDLYPAESVKSDSVNSWLVHLRRVEEMIQPLEVVTRNDAQRHLWFIEQNLNVPITAVANQPQRNQRLLALNEMFYPSSVSEPSFWNGRPH